MSPRSSDLPPLDRVAEALVLADTVDIASIEELDRSVAALQRWASKHASDDAKAVVAELARATRDLRRDPEAGPRALERAGQLFCTADSLLNTARFAPVLAAKTPAPAGAEPVGPITSDAAPAAAPQLGDDPELIADFMTRATEHLENAEEHLIALEQHPNDAEALNATFRAFHTIKGMAGFLSLTEIQTLAHAAEGVLDGPRHGNAELGPAALSSLFGSIDSLRRLVAHLGATEENDDSPAAGASTAGRQRIAARGDHADNWTPDSVAPQAAVTRTVRVDEERLDRLVDMIGELVIAETMSSEAAKGLGEEWTALSQQFAQVDKITRRLQEMATSLRMVPLRSTFRRMARVTRDMSHSAGKPIEFAVTGEDTELDKEMVDRIADPLTHLLRNAIDHGLESPAERLAAGKPESGHVGLHAYHRGGAINIEITDDGRGMDAEAILAAARERGLVRPDERPSERDLLRLAFEPGFSTAETITEVSGRGVGMDVVKRTVDGLRGHVEIDSTPGAGTRFTIRLPLTMAIIEGMVLRVADERYVLPLASIERSIRPTPAQLSSAMGGRAHMLDTGDGLVPIVRLDGLFGVDGAEKDPTNAVVVIVNEAGRRAGLLACELLGQQQTVIKPLGDAFRDSAGLAGGAIMPDGRIGLILDVAGLVQLASTEGGV